LIIIKPLLIGAAIPLLAPVIITVRWRKNKRGIEEKRK
jgi:hypothetical protein